MAKKIKVLIVEDERPIAQALKLKLNKEGIEAQIAINGQEALEVLKKNKFDLLLLDLVMPKMDGFEFLEIAKKKKINTPIIVSSNLNQEEDIKKAKELGAKDFLVKSNTSLSEVVNRIKNVLKP